MRTLLKHVARVAACVVPFVAAPIFTQSAWAQSFDAASLYQVPPGQSTHWASPENRAGDDGVGGIENTGAKGHPFDTLAPGQSLVLADIQGTGIIDRFWLTVGDRSPEGLRALRLEITWDGAATPAVSVPLGDFFAQNLGPMVPMDTALLVSAEGRSFVSYIPMPFRTGARVKIINDSKDISTVIYYDVDYRRVQALPEDALYFHAWWSRNPATTPGQAFQVLPRISGHGRFLGMSVGVQTNPAYGKSWWGEGEVRMFLNKDQAHPSLVGTGTEDYIGSGWGQSAYSNRFQGAPVADETLGRWSFYRFHVPDPVIFDSGIEVTWQQIGGAVRTDVKQMQDRGAPLIPITIDASAKGFIHLLDGDATAAMKDPALADSWTNFYRSDDVSAVAYFYLDRPEDGLPPIAAVEARTADLRAPAR